MADNNKFSLGGIFRENKKNLLFVYFLICIEAASLVLIPLFIGIGIDGLLEENYQPLIFLFLLLFFILVVGSIRRFLDTRVYARIYQKSAHKMVSQEKMSGASVSTISARCSLLNELIEFFEKEVFSILGLLIGIIGILIILSVINIYLLAGCLLIAMLFGFIYCLSSKKIFRFNKAYNDQLEYQVSAVEADNERVLKRHLKKMMFWNVRLSDMETLNSFLLFAGMSLFLPYSIWLMVRSGSSSYGEIFSAIMYVYEYTIMTIELPIFVERIIRLIEINRRFQD